MIEAITFHAFSPSRSEEFSQSQLSTSVRATAMGQNPITFQSAESVERPVWRLAAICSNDFIQAAKYLHTSQLSMMTAWSSKSFVVQ